MNIGKMPLNSQPTKKIVPSIQAGPS